ncbi:MAG: hypothetical protein ACI4P3_03510 [Candidatus Spyradosoma sp.]
MTTASSLKTSTLTLIAGTLALAASGCASIVSERNYPVRIDSYPQGATFAVRNENFDIVCTGTTPKTVFLESDSGFFKKAKYNIFFSLDGRENTTVDFNASIDPWYFGNILFGGLVGMLIVDPATGAMWELEKSVTVNLPKEK